MYTHRKAWRHLLFASFVLSFLTNKVWPTSLHLPIRQHKVVCMERIQSAPRTTYDALFEQILIYLENYYRILSKPSTHCDSAEILIDSRQTLKTSARYRCLDALPTIKRQLRHVAAILEDPAAAKVCFDPSFTGLKQILRSYTPSFAILHPRYNFTERQLKSLWMSSAWIPFYLNRKEAGSDKFREGYFYTELLGPYGMLAIKSIDGEHFDHELGLTVQRGATVYPRHYHNAGELYITLSKTACKHSQQVLITPYNNKHQDSHSVLTDYLDTTPNHNAIYYIAPNYLHSFKSQHCEGRELPLISLWARIGIYKGEQKTHFLHRNSQQTH